MKKILLILLAITSSCWTISGPEDPTEFITEIERVDVSHNPIKLGENITITCIIKDSALTNVEFVWVISGYQQVIVTKTNSLTVEAKVLGVNSDIVRVRSDTVSSKVSVKAEFEYQVIE